MFVGIDVSANRGFDVAIIDGGRHLTMLAKVRDLDTLDMIVRGAPKEAVFAVDSPPAPAKGLVGEGRSGRVAEVQAMARGISLYAVPSSAEAAPAWMKAGFGVFRLLDRAGFPLFTGGTDRLGVAFEVYPYLSYVVLSGTKRPRSTAPLEWTRKVIKGHVLGLPSDLTKDGCDAAVAAFTAWSFAQGRWSGLGDPREGVIVAPCEVDELPRTQAERDQLMLPIEVAEGHEPIGPMKAPTFSERVLRTIAQIPRGAVTTYGDVARWCGKPGGARAVGTLISAREFEVPSHRVVSASGALSAAFPGGPEEQRRRLESESVPFEGTRVAVDTCRWKGPA